MLSRLVAPSLCELTNDSGRRSYLRHIAEKKKQKTAESSKSKQKFKNQKQLGDSKSQISAAQPSQPSKEGGHGPAEELEQVAQSPAANFGIWDFQPDKESLNS